MNSGNLVPSEFGGHGGEIEPEPHPLTSAEKLRLAFRSEPTDPETNPDDLRVKYQEVEDSGFEEKQ